MLFTKSITKTTIRFGAIFKAGTCKGSRGGGNNAVDFGY